ncbi:MAG TPA: 6-bladed beta-propeller [Opitutus sp.]|nr:6-bladed beta-propeller [Opitutus sp.]
MKPVHSHRAGRTAAWILALGLALGTSAAGAAAAPPKEDYAFFPGPPNEPHLQFLTAFSSEREMGRNARRSFTSWLTGKKPAEKQISKPYGGVVHDHKLYLCDTDYGAVLVADLQTRSMSLFNAHGEGTLQVPLNISVDAAGNFYVADSGRNQIVIFDRDSNYVAAVGKAGEMAPRDVAVGPDRFYVADLKGHCVRVYDRNTREPLFTIPRESEPKKDAAKLYMPTNLALDPHGRLYVSDTGGFEIQVFDAATGNYERSVGEMGDGLGQFARVKGIAVDRDCRLYAVDAMTQVAQIFDEQGRLLTWFGDPFGADMRNLPSKVMVDYDDVDAFRGMIAPGFQVEYLVFVINQIGPHKVSVYGFGHPK